ncbi:MAG: GNAT family N-acetyltransferase [Gemmataceae bacterium]|nr:GNAT family N-acetyltransferase [Gemmataceae bacterium]
MRKHTYFKRYRMEVDLRRPPSGVFGPAVLPAGFVWVAWHDSLLDAHAEVKALSFADETDSVVFPSLGSLDGCRELMVAIRGRPGFCPPATWLVAAPAADGSWPAGGCVATIQGLVDEAGFGAVQNVGVLPDYRGRGIGRALLLKALRGFAAVGARRAFLEVTAQNAPAVRMYRDLGFRCYRTIYKAVPVREPAVVGS